MYRLAIAAVTTSMLPLASGALCAILSAPKSTETLYWFGISSHGFLSMSLILCPNVPSKKAVVTLEWDL